MIKNYSFDPVQLAEKTSNAFSADSFNSWVQVIRLLAERGYNAWEAEAIVRSKWTRWCRDEFHTNSSRKATSSSLAKFLDKYGHKPRSKGVNELVFQTFENEDLVPNEQGLPCRKEKNLMNGAPILVPLGTPISCDASSETYWSM
jgi:hypothetical protein